MFQAFTVCSRLLLCVPGFYRVFWTFTVCSRLFTVSVFCHTQVHVSDTQSHVGGKECTSSNGSVVDLDDCLNLYIRRKPLTWYDLNNLIWHYF